MIKLNIKIFVNLKKFEKSENMKWFSISLFLILLLSGCSSSKEEYTNNIYQIPKGYEGSITVFYDVPNKPKLKKEGKYSVISVNELALDALATTDMHIYGAAFTSTPDMEYGTVNDQYFYVDKNGERTAINKRCVYVGNNGGFTGASGKEISYNNIQVTQSNCSENFRFNGKDSNFTQQKEVMSYWMSYFD